MTSTVLVAGTGTAAADFTAMASWSTIERLNETMGSPGFSGVFLLTRTAWIAEKKPPPKGDKEGVSLLLNSIGNMRHKLNLFSRGKFQGRCIDETCKNRSRYCYAQTYLRLI